MERKKIEAGRRERWWDGEREAEPRSSKNLQAWQWVETYSKGSREAFIHFEWWIRLSQCIFWKDHPIQPLYEDWVERKPAYDFNVVDKVKRRIQKGYSGAQISGYGWKIKFNPMFPVSSVCSKPSFLWVVLSMASTSSPPVVQPSML